MIRRAPAFVPTLPLAAALALAACTGPVAPPRSPSPAPVRTPIATPVPATPPPPRAADWRDWPVTPGDWRYAREGRDSVARFGAGGATLLAVRCTAGQVRLSVTNGGAQAIVRTSSVSRSLPLGTGADGVASAALVVGDPLLDAMGFSRGRFAVESPPLRPIVVPAWAEVLRVVEDCRG